MDPDQIESPQPVLSTGSAPTSAVPLLEERTATEPGEIHADDTKAQPVSLPSDIEASDETENTVLSTDVEQPASAITIVDDTVVHTSEKPESPVPVATRASPDSDAKAATSIAVPEGDVDIPSDTKYNDSPAEGVPEATQEPVTSQTQPAPGLPSGVDLQKLLSTFSAMTDLPSTEPQEAKPIAVVPPPLPSKAADPLKPAEMPAPRPTVPWQTSTATPIQAARPPSSHSSDDALFEQFLIDEKRIMGNTAPHEFEPGSRLFIGNMNIDTINKRQVFFIFKKYGKLAQVSLKSTYGFVQFLTSRECRNAVEGEQGLDIAGRKLQLEVCKPQLPRNAAATQSRRRSRSPPRKSNTPISYGRDSYDSYKRPPSPPRRVSPGRFHTPHESHYPSRRSPSPRRYAPPIPNDPLPPRYGSQVPEVQIVVLDQSDRSYVHWVESSIRQAGLKVDTIFLSPQLELPVVVRQMAKEGVLAIVHCHRQLQMSNKVTLQVFDRSHGNSVRFDEYAGLDITAAIALLRRSQQQAAYASHPPAVAAPQPPQQANLAAMIAQMDPASLQQVIGALSQQQQGNNVPPPGNPYPYRRY